MLRAALILTATTLFAGCALSPQMLSLIHI